MAPMLTIEKVGCVYMCASNGLKGSHPDIEFFRVCVCNLCVFLIKKEDF